MLGYVQNDPRFPKRLRGWGLLTPTLSHWFLLVKGRLASYNKHCLGPGEGSLQAEAGVGGGGGQPPQNEAARH